MQFVLYVTGPAYGTQNARNAYLFAQSILSNSNNKNNHRLDLIFFYGDGIYNANRCVYPASDEFDLVHAWSIIHHKYDIPLYICSSAAMRRGVGVFTNSKTLERINNIKSGFKIRGLGSLVQSILHCERLVQF
ncbi:MAG: sulfurtransferase complex subunit TusD [Candidatus Dasytiphilus stammeri]